MKKTIKIKYTDGYEKIRKIIPSLDFTYEFHRNVWVDVPVDVALLLLKDRGFISEDDIIFNPEIFHSGKLNIGIKRFGAFGDLIQLIPIVKHLKTISKNRYTLITNSCYIQDFIDFDVFDDVLPTNTNLKVFDKVIYLDGVAERDHSNTNKERLMHRIKIFEEFLNVAVPKYDFGVKINNLNKKRVDEVLNNAIALQQNKADSVDIQKWNTIPNSDSAQNDCGFEWVQGLSEARF